MVTFIVNAKNLPIKLELSNENESETPILKVKGTLFFLNANKFIDALSEEFEHSNVVTVDMSELQRIDETALEKLVTLNKKIKAKGKSLELLDYNDKIRQRLDKYFKVL